MQPIRPLACIGVSTVLLTVGAAAGDVPSAGHILRTDPSGAWLETIFGEPVADPPPGHSPRDGILWQIHDANAIAERICVSDTADETWIGWNLNDERLTYLQTTGTGTPYWEYDLSRVNPDSVVVASAEDASLGLVGVMIAATPAAVHAFDDASGAAPIWSYTFDAGYEIVQTHSIDVAADGSIVLAAASANATTDAMLVVLDGATGAELRRREIAGSRIFALELSDDGSRAVLTEGANAVIIETAGLTDLFSFSVSGAGGEARLSRDGMVAAAGGFNYMAYRDTGSGWTRVYYGSGSSQWFGNGIALSGNGDTMFVVDHNYATGYLFLTYRLIDLVAGVEIASKTTSGSGSLQDAVRRAEASGDGEVFACISWGSQDNAHPEVQIFDRALDRIGEIDTPGSPFSLDLSRDGQYVVAGTKAVHANTFGRGGDAYAYELSRGCPPDYNGDGVLNSQDFIAFLNDFVAGNMNADYNGDGVLNSQDFIAFLNDFVAGC